MDKRRKHFAKLRAEEIKKKPPTKAQKRNQICTYLKNMANYKHSQLKNKSFEEIQMLFYNTMKWVDSFIPMDTKVVEGSKSQAEGNENVEAEVEDEAEMKKLMEIVPNYEVAIDAIPLVIKTLTEKTWKHTGSLVKAKHGSTEARGGYERVYIGNPDGHSYWIKTSQDSMSHAHTCKDIMKAQVHVSRLPLL
ncbi:hypothetical protein Tco_0497310 [Tanacetum coccineum]